MIDDLDNSILDLLRRDPRMANKTMAKMLDVSESTIGARLERLSISNVARVVGQRNYRSEGWGVSAMLEIWTSRSDNEALIDRLNTHASVVTIYEFSGRPELWIKIAAVDLDSVTAFAYGVVGADPAVDRLAVHVCLRHGYVRQGFGNLEAPNPTIASLSGDSTHQILEMLGRDGRISNREIARTLGIAEATVRTRVRKLLEQRALRYILVVDPAKAGYSALAFAFFKVRSEYIDAAIEQMAALPEVFGVTILTGKRNFLLSIYSPTWTRTLSVFEEICHTLPGDSDPQLRPAKQFARHHYQLAFLPPAGAK